MDIQIDDEWSQVKILNEADLTGMEKHPLPKEGINNEKSVEKILEMMMADQSVPLNDIGDIKLSTGEQKNKRFKFHNDTGADLELEVFSNMPNYIEVTTPTLKIPFNKKT